MKILITGAAGYIGPGLIEAFEGSHDLRLMDVTAMESPHETIVGTVADLAAVRDAVEGVDALLIAHMATRQAGAYDTPTDAFDVNVKGTANLFFAALEAGVRKVALVSSYGVVKRHAEEDGTFVSRDLPHRPRGMYMLTKVCQEVIAEQYHRQHGLAVAVLRPSKLLYEDTMTDKYGDPIPRETWNLIDPRDIGQAARLALELPDLTYEVFYLLSKPEAATRVDTTHTRDRLGWDPEYPFAQEPGSSGS